MFKRVLSFLLLGVAIAVPFIVLGEDAAPTAAGFETLSQIPGVAGSTASLGTYVNALFRIAIGLGAVIAVLMIVIGGFEYLSTDLFQRKSAGKERIQNSLLGLGLLLVSTLLLQTINPKLLDLSFQPLRAEITFETMNDPGVYSVTRQCIGETNMTSRGGPYLPTMGQCYETAAECAAAQTARREQLGTGSNVSVSCTAQETRIEFDGCEDCMTVEEARAAGLVISPRACVTGGGERACLIPNTNGMADTLGEISASGVIGTVTVTEAWPPSPVHQNRCHAQGTCLDFDISPANANTITTALRVAYDNGNTAVWEVRTQAERDALMRGLTPEQQRFYGQWICVEPHITGDHFSLYSNSRVGCNASTGR